MKRDDIAGRARDLGKLALDAFRGVQAKHPQHIAGVRGLGLMIGIVLTGPGDTQSTQPCASAASSATWRMALCSGCCRR